MSYGPNGYCCTLCAAEAAQARGEEPNEHLRAAMARPKNPVLEDWLKGSRTVERIHGLVGQLAR